MKLKTVLEKVIDFIFPPLSSWKTYENVIGAPMIDFYIDELIVGISLKEFCSHIGWIKSSSDFRRLIKSNGLKVNNKSETNESKILWLTDMDIYIDDKGNKIFEGIRLSKGKQDVAVLRWNRNKRRLIERIRWYIEQKLEFYNII